MYVWVHFVVNVCRWFVLFLEDTPPNFFEKMDRIWMTKSRTSLEYQRGVDEFLEHAAQMQEWVIAFTVRVCDVVINRYGLLKM